MELNEKVEEKRKEYEATLKTKQQQLTELENTKQQLMVNIFQLQGAIQALKDIKEPEKK